MAAMVRMIYGRREMDLIPNGGYPSPASSPKLMRQPSRDTDVRQRLVEP